MPISIREILSSSWKLYRQNFLLIIGIAALGHVLGLSQTLLSFLSFDTIGFLFGLLTGIPSALIAVWSAAALVIAISQRSVNQTITIKAAFNGVKGKYWRFIGISTLYFLTLAAGLLLFIIPGLYWGTMFTLAPIAVLLENRRDIGPFKLSQRLIRGSFWKVFAIGFMVSVLVNIPSLLLFKLQVHQQVAHLFFRVLAVVFMPFFYNS